MYIFLICYNSFGSHLHYQHKNTNIIMAELALGTYIDVNKCIGNFHKFFIGNNKDLFTFKAYHYFSWSKKAIVNVNTNLLHAIFCSLYGFSCSFMIKKCYKFIQHKDYFHNFLAQFFIQWKIKKLYWIGCSILLYFHGISKIFTQHM